MRSIEKEKKLTGKEIPTEQQTFLMNRVWVWVPGKTPVFCSKTQFHDALSHVLCTALGWHGWLVHKALASHQGDPGSILGAFCELSRALVLCCATRVFQTKQFPPSRKIKHFWSWLCSVVIMGWCGRQLNAPLHACFSNTLSQLNSKRRVRMISLPNYYYYYLLLFMKEPSALVAKRRGSPRCFWLDWQQGVPHVNHYMVLFWFSICLITGIWATTSLQLWGPRL